MRTILFFISVVFLALSCTKPDEAVLPLVGIYRTHILGVAGPFDMVVSTDRGSRMFIDAPFDGSDWYVIRINVHNAEDEIKEIRIPDQTIDCCTSISGKGFYLNGSAEINYTLNRDGRKQNFKMVGAQR